MGPKPTRSCTKSLFVCSPDSFYGRHETTGLKGHGFKGGNNGGNFIMCIWQLRVLLGSKYPPIQTVWLASSECNGLRSGPRLFLWAWIMNIT